MIVNEWTKCLKHITKESHKWPELYNFFSLTFSILFLFPSLNQFLFVDKETYLVQLAKRSNYWEIKWLKHYFEFRMNESFLSYLNQDDWWWIFLKRIEDDKNHLEPYIFSNFHENLRKPNERKKSGIFFTPLNQIKVICRYALFSFLSNRKDIALDDKSLHELSFRGKYPVNYQFIDNYQIVDRIASIRILDPSCGTGMFLAEMSRLLLSIILANPINVNISPEEKIEIMNTLFSRLYGYDIDSRIVKCAKIILLHQYLKYIPNETFSEKKLNSLIKKFQIFETDFLSDDKSSHHKFHIIIGNPPYVRHHGIKNTSIKTTKDISKFFKYLFSEISLKWDKKADLYIYFWLKAITQVVGGGTIAFVLSRAWLSSRYTNPLKQIFLTSFCLDLILELPFEVWDNAEIRTHIVIGHRIHKKAELKNTTIIVWKNSLKSLLQFGIHNFTKDLEKLSFKPANIRFEIQTKETDLYRISLISDLTPLMMNSRKLFPFLRLDYLTMSSYLIKLLKDKKDQFCLLKDLGKLEMGSTTGANRFFYFTKKLKKQFNFPKENLYLMTKSPKEWGTIFSPSKELGYFLHIPRKLTEDSPNELQDYINKNQDDILKRPYFKNRTKENWYQVPLIQPEILIPNMSFKRSFVIYNSDELHIDKQWIGFWANNKDWLFPLLGFLNSTLGILLREIQGTRTLGLGSLKLSLQECQNLLVLNPRKLSKNHINQFQACISSHKETKIESILTTKKLISDYSKFVNQLDHLVLIECLGMNSRDVTKIHEILQFELYWRFAKEKTRKK
ncbi:MAG: N-6 DNA methylase [Candidatus Heimdallarchaeota archaeon]|nr:MAG: N-6 DNA methylase [Candidatus Heimdallarchaeota archaeon]